MINEPIESDHESKESTPRNKEKEKEVLPVLSKNSSELSIKNFKYENKDLELTCENFIESLFLVDPKNFDSLGQSQVKIRRLPDSRNNLLNSKKNFSSDNSQNTQSRNQLNSEKINNNSNYNSNQKDESIEQINEPENKEENNIVNNQSNPDLNNNIPSKNKNIEQNQNNDSEKENNSNLANSQINANRPNNSGSSSGRTLICQNFVNDIFNSKNHPNDKGDELNKIEKVKMDNNSEIPSQNQSQKLMKIEEIKEVKNKEETENNAKRDSFQMTPEQAKYLLEHKNEIITIQKNWKTYYDVNRFKLLKSKALILQHFYRKYLIKKYNLPANFYYNDKFLKMQTELYEDTYKKNLSILFPSLFMDKSDLNEFASNMLAMANNPIHSPYQPGQVYLFAKILDFDMMIDTNECYETLWASIYDSIYSKCLQNNDPIQHISLGSQHTICVTNRGKIYTFGWNNYGQCGVPINSTVVLKSELNNNRLIDVNKFNEIELRILNRVDGVKIPQIDEIIFSNSITCGEDYTLIVDREGKLWSFGLNFNGQLGLGHCNQIDKPIQVEFDIFDENNNKIKKTKKNKIKFNSVKSAGYINFCTSEDGDIYMWPWGDKQGNLHYNPNKFFLSSPQEKVVSVSCGNNFCVMINNNGMVYSMGKSNKYGELGVGDFNPRYGPTPIDFFILNYERINQISCGFKHCVAKSTTGRVYSWGCGCKGQLGQDNYNNMSIPGLVRFEDPFMKIIQVSAGFRCTFFLNENRKVYSCGCNGTISMEKTPILFDIVDKVPEMSLEQNYSVVRINNTWCKSFSIFYATVADTTTLKMSPVRISSILNNLASKWNNDNINPPYIETIENFFPVNFMKRPNKKI